VIGELTKARSPLFRTFYATTYNSGFHGSPALARKRRKIRFGAAHFSCDPLASTIELSASVRPRVDEVRERILLATDRERCCPGAGRPWADSRRVYSRGGESISCSLAHGSSKDGRIVGACRCVASSSSRIKVGHLSSPLGRRTLPDADADHSASPFPTGFLHRGSGIVGG